MPEPTLHPTHTGDVERPGITLRAYFALELSKAMLIYGDTNSRSPKYFVDTAIPIADALLEALNGAKQ